MPNAWVLVPPYVSSTIAARLDVEKPAPSPMRATVVIACVCVPISYGSLHHLGTAALDHARHQDSFARQIAAAMPGSRQEALDLLARELDSEFAPTEDTFRLGVQLEKVRAGCPVSLSRDRPSR